MKKNIALKIIKETDLKNIWDISYGSQADLEWMTFNGPYFKDPIQTWETFSFGYGQVIIDSPMHKAVIVDDTLVGIVSAYWEDGDLKQWLDVGIVLYDATIWGQGIGHVALSLWLDELFNQFSYLPHIGFTTFSGNKGMQRIGDKCGMKKEGVIRKVRYWNGRYYDSVKYGILREEFKRLPNSKSCLTSER